MIHLLISIFLYLVFIYLYKNSLLLFLGRLWKYKGSTSWYVKHASRNVQTSVQGYGQRNGYNCNMGGSISTTTCFKYVEIATRWWSLVKRVAFTKWARGQIMTQVLFLDHSRDDHSRSDHSRDDHNRSDHSRSDQSLFLDWLSKIEKSNIIVS